MAKGWGAAAASGEEKGQGMGVFFGNHGGVSLEAVEEFFFSWLYSDCIKMKRMPHLLCKLE